MLMLCCIIKLLSNAYINLIDEMRFFIKKITKKLQITVEVISNSKNSFFLKTGLHWVLHHNIETNLAKIIHEKQNHEILRFSIASTLLLKIVRQF